VIVGVDARHLTARRGVARYTRRMLAALARRAQVRALVPGRAAVKPVPGVELVRTALPSRLFHGLAALAGWPTVDGALDGPDVTWLPAPAPAAVRGRYVLTVHDLSWLERPGDFTAYERAWHRAMRFERLLERAAAVVCDASAVAESLAARFGVRAAVVEPGVDVRPAEPYPGRYVLYVGALEPRKGLDVLAAAWARRPLPDAELLIAGEGRVRVEGARHLGHVDDEALHSLYAGALAVVLPSRLEGYGLTPREAAAHGTPSVVSDLPTLRLPGTMRVPPGDPDALADALARLPAERERLAAELPAPRTWAEAAAELHAVLEEAAR
jgi:glycosyltransferase involved in cell wall biosynthesis